MIARIHFEQVKADPDLIRIRPRDLEQKRHSFLEKNGCSSRFLSCVEAGGLSSWKMEESINAPIPHVKTFTTGPSTFLPVSATYDVIRYCDAMMQVNEKQFELDQEPFKWNPTELIAKAISYLSEAGSQSWCQPGNYVEEWPKELAKAFSGAGTPVRLYAQYSTLRSASVTVMMRMPGELWPGLENTEPVTNLAYLA
ncbi:hypothetical protein BPAE_0081g00280 [Botrytis paeoniae]|uniref:Uncharacterized protein n=1 Tax=Botrytis paeoniae TaxID=278948 RepID=A0A4Z1FLL5_9HELO|nr:hypothetical protein BPAE_0081g00280 [Botrytis paeoniae]